MVELGNFFFKYRNLLFIFLYILLFVPSPPLFEQDSFGEDYHYWPIVTGLLVTVSGQMIRGATIGLAYIVRGGKDGKVYADKLVTEGIFNHCRNPLYIGNILMLLGVGILSNSLIYVVIIMPLFVLIYHSIVLAEENYLKKKFGESYISYCNKVSRWIPSFTNLSDTFSRMHFKWKRWILKEYNTQYLWLSGITLILLMKYPVLTNHDTDTRYFLLATILTFLLLIYLFIRYRKKSGRLKE